MKLNYNFQRWWGGGIQAKKKKTFRFSVIFCETVLTLSQLRINLFSNVRFFFHFFTFLARFPYVLWKSYFVVLSLQALSSGISAEQVG